MSRVAGIALLAAVAAAPAVAATPATVSPPTFPGLPGAWRHFDDAPVVWTRHGAESEAYATSWRYSPGPDGPAGRLPRDGTLVTVHLYAHCGAPRYRVTQPPLRLPNTTHATLEGEPHVPEYRIFGRLRGSYDFEVRVDVNDPHPSRAQLDTAARVVRSIRLPRWPKPRC